MNRCLHITINEGSGPAPQGATATPFGNPGTDPGSDVVMPPLKDPGSDVVMPPLKDPSDTSSSAAGSGGFGTVVASTGACGCCCGSAGHGVAASGTAAAPSPYVTSRDYSGFVIVRTAEGVVSPQSLAESLRALAEEHTPKLSGLIAVLELALPKTSGETPEALSVSTAPPAGTLVSRPLVELLGECGDPLLRGESLAILRALEARTAATAFPPLHSLTSYWRLDLREHPDLEEDVVARLNRLAEVDLAYRELAAADPANGGTVGGESFAEDQGYLDDAPAGISASWARQSLAAAASLTSAPSPKLTICDLEQGWNPDHRDLAPLVPPAVIYGANRAPNEGSSGHHGTAVLGQLAPGTSPFGIRGAAAGLGQFVLASHYKAKAENHPFAGTNGHLAAAIAQALALPYPPSLAPFVPLKAGDVLLLEVQRGLLPAEVDEADFDAIRLASGLGIIVIEAAGNGGFDLDGYSNPDTHRSLHRGSAGFRDSGAVFVGAARASLPHDRAPFSNHGSRLDCFGWGETVTTCGFGDLAGTGTTDLYTNTFSGTSSASPIVAGAAALLQSLHQAHAGERLGPRAMRALLADPATGTRQGPNVPGHIGVMPDLKAIVRGSLQLVPDVYLRRSIGDDGSTPGMDEEVSSSPDILVWPKGLAKAKARWGEGKRRGNVPAPGGTIVTGQPNNLYVRLRNRGLGPGEAHVQLFASPAATLITTERWIPVDRLDASLVGQIPQGDTLFVAGPIVWPSPPPTTTPAPWSFLAVLTRPGEGPTPLGPPYFDWAAGLPPGPPYFDWAQFRAFLRKPGVAWRNVHQVPTASTLLPFAIAGTPERAHVFDFEVIQRLPAGTTATLQVPPALAAKLRQRQPWLGGGTGPLPKRPRTAIRGVELAAGTYADATFTLQGTAPATGHSLAIRQLWRGEEVGRITWVFGPEP